MEEFLVIIEELNNNSLIDNINFNYSKATFSYLGLFLVEYALVPKELES